VLTEGAVCPIRHERGFHIQNPADRETATHLDRASDAVDDVVPHALEDAPRLLDRGDDGREALLREYDVGRALRRVRRALDLSRDVYARHSRHF